VLWVSTHFKANAVGDRSTECLKLADWPSNTRSSQEHVDCSAREGASGDSGGNMNTYIHPSSSTGVVDLAARTRATPAVKILSRRYSAPKDLDATETDACSCEQLSSV
jgi:hypothetical protein